MTTQGTTQVAADLRAAADVLERDGWTQGKYHSIDGCHCALGALAVVISRSNRANPDRWSPWAGRSQRLALDARAVMEAVGRADDFPRISTTDWNDEPERTAAEVIAALRAAADRAEGDE